MSARIAIPAVFLGLLLVTSSVRAQTLCYAENDGPNYLDTVSMGGPNLLLAVQFTPNVAFNATAIEVFTGERTGTNTVALWDHDPVANQPGTQLAIGTWSMSSTNSWQGAQLGAPVQVASGTTYWMVWGCVNGSQCSVDLAATTPGQPYRGSFNAGLSWNGPYSFNDRQWKFRFYGNSCSGAFLPY